MARLPKTFGGADVVRGLGMDSDAMDSLVDRKALGRFDASREIYVVVDDRCLSDAYSTAEIKAFANKRDAIRYARACGNGNVDQRVLTVTAQTLVVATENDL